MSDYKGWEALMILPTDELTLLKEMIDKELNKRPVFLFKKLKGLVEYCFKKERDDFTDSWADIWDEFWKISKQLQEFWDVEYYDPDTTYKEDILARFNSYKEYYEENNNANNS